MRWYGTLTRGLWSTRLDVLHISGGFVFVARLVAPDGAHLIVIVIVFVGIFGGVL